MTQTAQATSAVAILVLLVLPAIGSAIAERPRPGRDVATWPNGGIALVLLRLTGTGFSNRLLVSAIAKILLQQQDSN